MAKTDRELVAASSTATLTMSMPKGGRTMAPAPRAVSPASRGRAPNRPRMSSTFRDPMRCSTLPTHRNSRALDTAWTAMNAMPTVREAGVLSPAQTRIRPRLPTVE